jgi:hypothetical protein
MHNYLTVQHRSGPIDPYILPAYVGHCGLARVFANQTLHEQVSGPRTHAVLNNCKTMSWMRDRNVSEVYLVRNRRLCAQRNLECQNGPRLLHKSRCFLHNDSPIIAYNRPIIARPLGKQQWHAPRQ